eukprot:SAG11_NODE_11285_length_771_cov_0.964286_1_plen_93_part_00
MHHTISKFIYSYHRVGWSISLLLPFMYDVVTLAQVSSVQHPRQVQEREHFECINRRVAIARLFVMQHAVSHAVTPRCSVHARRGAGAPRPRR